MLIKPCQYITRYIKSFFVPQNASYTCPLPTTNIRKYYVLPNIIKFIYFYSMKKIIIIPIITLFSCSTPKQVATTTEIRINDTITEIVTTNPCEELTRQERLALKDSMKHELKMSKVERLVIKDSIKWTNKTRWIDRVRFKDSIRYVTKQVVKEIKAETKQSKRSLWWAWIIVGIAVFSILLNLFLLFIRK